MAILSLASFSTLHQTVQHSPILLHCTIACSVDHFHLWPFTVAVCLCCGQTSPQHVSKTCRTTNLGPPNAFAANRRKQVCATRQTKGTLGHTEDGIETVCDHPAAWRRCLRRRKPFLVHARSARGTSRRCHASMAGLRRYTCASSGERRHG